MILKICGITNQEDATAAVEAGANAIGFNFYPGSPRYIAPERAAEIGTPAGVRRVGVFVNEARERVEETARMAALGVAQLHGDETAAEYPSGMAVWKGLRVTAEFDFSRFDECPAEALLLDGPAGELYGGAGKSFDWSLASAAAPRFGRALPVGRTSRSAFFNRNPRLLPGKKAGGPTNTVGTPARPTRIILAGGLDASNVARAIALAHPWGVDACSRIETAPGKKDRIKMKAFLEAAGAALGA
jgi:phosphoribosylanthranilate isomerase